MIRGLRRRIDKTIREERPKSPVGQACTYALGQWAGLLVYRDHGFVEIDNTSVYAARGINAGIALFDFPAQSVDGEVQPGEPRDIGYAFLTVDGDFGSGVP